MKSVVSRENHTFPSNSELFGGQTVCKVRSSAPFVDVFDQLCPRGCPICTPKLTPTHTVIRTAIVSLPKPCQMLRTRRAVISLIVVLKRTIESVVPAVLHSSPRFPGSPPLGTKTRRLRNVTKRSSDHGSACRSTIDRVPVVAPSVTHRAEVWRSPRLVDAQK